MWKCSSCSNWVWVYTQKMRTGRPQRFAFLKGGFWIYVFTVHSAAFKSTFPYINTLMRVAFQRKLCQQRLFNFYKYVWRFLNVILINIPCILKEIVLLLIWNLLMLYRALSCIIPQQNLSTFRILSSHYLAEITLKILAWLRCLKFAETKISMMPIWVCNEAPGMSL